MGINWVDANPAPRRKPQSASIIALLAATVIAGLSIVLTIVPSRSAEAQGWLSDPPAVTTVCQVTSAWDASYPMTIGGSQSIALGFCAGR